jgi:hypothetical protein
MSQFKISPLTQCKSQSKRSFLSRVLLTTFLIDIAVTGILFFRLSKRIDALERQANYATTKNEGEINVQ